MLTASERFWSKVDQSGECWEWQAGLNRTGYGQFWFEGQMVLAHRFALTLTDGPMPEDQLVCHHCDNRKCVRPDHLYLGDASDNQRDAVARGRHASQKKTHCPNGHEYTPENTMLDRGNRRCRTCRNRKDKEYRQQRKDFQAALAAARDEGYEAGLRARWGEREDRAFNAALDAAIGTGLAVEDVNRVLDLRKTPPQPEPLTREQQNERWRQDYNTQARLRKVDDWRLTEYPKPFEETPAAAQPEGES